jgi:hypothetical protein
MKWILRAMAITTLSLPASSAFGQACVPDTVLYTAPGIYPDSATGIPPAVEHVPYSIVITMIVPADTLIDFGGGPTLVTIDSIELIEIVNQPAWLMYDCEPPSCGFPGDAASCTLFHGTPPSASAGYDTVDIIINQHGNISGFPVAVPDTLFDFYVIRVIDPAGVEEAEDQGLSFGHVPAPFAEGDVIEINSSRTRTVTLTLFDITGKTVCRWEHEGIVGTTFTAPSIAELLPGTYLLGMSTGSGWVSRMLVVQ